MPKRERLSNTSSGDHFIRRDEKGRIEQEVSVGKSLATDRRSKAKTTVKPGYGDQGDQQVAPKKRAPAKKK